MSDNEYERFEITDYDLDNEFNINRPRRRQTKHQQIYGIWADDSDNDSGEEPSTSRRGRGRRGGLGSSGGNKPKDYTAPVSFVAGGIQQAGKKKKEKQPEDEVTVITDEDSDDEARPSFGAKKPQLRADASPHSSSNSSSDEVAAPSSTQRKVGFGQQQKSYVVGSGKVGAWEQHTRGIGAKLLLQMGYEPGKGLGKDLQGIAQPVEAHVRKGRGAIGAYGPEKAASVAGKPKAVKVDEDLREAKEFKEKLNKWKKNSDTVGQSKRRYYYKSVEEIIEKGQKSSSSLSTKLSKKLGNVPVIDMTGPERRVLSGYHALGSSRVMDEEIYTSATAPVNSKTAVGTKNFELPELMHNLQLIVDMCEQEIVAIDVAEREGLIQQGVLEQEQKNLTNILQLEQDHIRTLESALELLEELSEYNEDLTLERAEKLFIELQDNYAAEYKEFGLGDLAAGVIAPLVKNALEQWQPLVQPTQHVDLIKRWRSILQTDLQAQCEVRNVFDPYSSLIWAGVIPSFRACAAEWNPKKHQMMAALLDCWAPLFPTWILDSVLEQLILPRLCNGVRDWDPLTDTVPIHIWILPWNSVLGHKMEEYIFPTIREKLGTALQAWIPQDRSARAMLTPWKGAFNEAEMQIFLIQHIIPKLQLVLNEFIINPLQQDLESWNQVWEWRELIPTLLMAQLLDKYFFPKWMQVLVLWLNQSPDYTEISRWYSGWKNLLSEEILREPNIKEHFRRALEILHRATDQVANPATVGAGVSGIPAPTMINAPPPPQPPLLPPSLMDLQIPAPAQLEFKELVLQKCSERGIIFAPIPGRRELGKQVYRVGKLYCYIDRNVCMLSDNSFKNWTPSSVPQMLERAVTGAM